MEENLASSTTSLSLPSQSSLSQSSATEHQTPSKENFASQTPPFSVTRLWRPKAQQNLRNQWSKLASYRKEWSSSSFSARSNATDLVNSYLSLRYTKAMEFGVLNAMPDIKKKACWKLFTRQEIYRDKLLSSYKNMVASVANMHNSSRSMRTFLKSTSRSLTQFSNVQEDKNDNGDGGGIPVFTFLSMSSLEELAYEFVRMFSLELSLKRLLVIELLSLSSEKFQIDPISWSDELYPGELNNLSVCNLYSEDLCEPIHPEGKGSGSKRIVETAQCQLDEEVLQIVLAIKICTTFLCIRPDKWLASFPAVIHHRMGLQLLLDKETKLTSPKTLHVYLTTWLAEVYINTYRVEEILAVVGEEIHHSLS